MKRFGNRARWRVLAGIALAVACFAGMTPGAAGALEPADAAVSTDANDSTVVQTAEHDADAPVISLDKVTAVVTATSGYHLSATVTNTSDKDWPQGTLTATINPSFTFRSRTDVQQWAQGGMPVRARTNLGQVEVPALKAGDSAQVTIDAEPDTPALKAIGAWGAKPLMLTYANVEERPSTLHTFLTRSADGLTEAAGSPLDLTVALPVDANEWQLDEDTVDTLLTSGKTSSENDADAVEPIEPVETGEDLQSIRQLATDHKAVQIIAEPDTLAAMDKPLQTAAISQPAQFDITAWAARNDQNAYERAGVAGVVWTADAALNTFREAKGNTRSTTQVVATQGEANWTMQALTEAKRQGYDVVLADSSYEENASATVHTAKTVVPTDAGEVTVLVEQSELGTLAKGKATDRQAVAERTQAGRLARFMAQSAFYQMEEPYNARNLLVCLNQAKTEESKTLMTALKSAPWLRLTSLSTLLDAEPYEDAEEALANAPGDSGLSAAETDRLDAALNTLGDSREEILRFGSQMLDDDSASHDDAQALARQDAKRTSERTDATDWLASLTDTHDRLALHALAPDPNASGTEISQAVGFAQRVLGGVALTPTEAVTVVSETAQMPVTVRNDHPYPVTVEVTSKTDSMEIVTSRKAKVTVPPNGEAQVTFDIRVSTSGSANATIALMDRQERPFGAQQTTHITSVLRISDKTGFIIIGLAIAMGLLGLWRQFHRVKDPDE